MLVAIHPDLEAELEGLMNRGFLYEHSVGTLFGLIDNLFRGSIADADAMQTWGRLPYADNGVSPRLNLRCIDPTDGRITLISTLANRVLYLLSADEATNSGRARAISAAAKRVVDLTWAQPE